MQATLHGVSGPASLIKVALEAEHPLTVGRGEQAVLRVPADTALSSLHFAVEIRDGHLLLRDLGSTNGTFVNGVRVQGCSLGHSDAILAGQSVFRVEILREIPDPLAVLAAETEPLYAILDAAREPRVLELLRLSGARFVCLHQGKLAAQMELVAPYLVPLASQPGLLQQIVQEGWGKAWGIFFTCQEPVDAIWRQLTRSLMVSLEDGEAEVYFRYYDPRVLREVVPILDAKQLEEFAGPIQRFLMEDEEPESLLRFTRGDGAGKIESITVGPVTK